MKILGIDPGSRKAGWAIIEAKGKKVSYIASGVIKLDHIPNLLDRLALISNETKLISEQYGPTVVALESLIYVKNVNSLAKLAQARGAMIAGLGESFRGMIFEYSPNLIKSSVTGHGHATKEGVEKTLKMIFGDIAFKTADESDALAVAMCHSLNLGKEQSHSLKKSGSRSLKQAFKHLAK